MAEPGDTRLQFLVGVHVTRTTDVQKPFGVIAENQGNLKDLGGPPPITNRSGKASAVSEIGIALACATACVHDAVILIQDHHDFAALLDQEPPAITVV